MEIYNENQPDDNGSYTPSERKPFFPTSELNFRTPLWEKIVFFLWGFLGLSILSSIFSVILSAFINSGVLSSALAQVLLMFFCYGLLAGGFLLLIFLDKRKTYVTIFKAFKEKETYIYAMIAIAGVLAVNYFFGILDATVFKDFYQTSSNQAGISSQVDTNPFLMFFAVVLFAPFAEELTYRVGIVDTIGKKNRWLGIILGALIFGMIHFGWDILIEYIELLGVDSEYVTISGKEVLTSEVVAQYASVLISELLNFPVYALSGFVFAFVYAKSGRIASTMTAHMVINLISFVEMVVLYTASLNTGSTFLRL